MSWRRGVAAMSGSQGSLTNSLGFRIPRLHEGKLFVKETFRDKFFQSGAHQIIDNIRANIDDLQAFKMDIALFALARTCISASGVYSAASVPHDTLGSGGVTIWVFID